MKKLILAALVAIVIPFPALAANEWQKIGQGPSFEIAEARCEIAAMGVGDGYMAIGDPYFVAGAALGNAIGNAIQQHQFKKHCMTLQGWKFVYRTGPTAKTKLGKFQQGAKGLTAKKPKRARGDTNVGTASSKVWCSVHATNGYMTGGYGGC